MQAGSMLMNGAGAGGGGGGDTAINNTKAPPTMIGTTSNGVHHVGNDHATSASKEHHHHPPVQQQQQQQQQEKQKRPPSTSIDNNTENKRRKVNQEEKEQEDGGAVIMMRHPQRYQEFDEGTRVYCRWPRNECWYWGKIRARFKKHHSHFFRYEVQFDDGDVLKGISAKYIINEEQYRNIFHKDPPEENNQSVIISKKEKEKEKNEKQKQGEQQQPKFVRVAIKHKVYQNDIVHSFSVEKLHELRCGTCEQCQKPDCTNCAICRNNNNRNRNENNNTPPQHGCCFQKMCCEIPDVNKAQVAKGFPTGHSFIFYPVSKNQAHDGLAIFDPNGHMYESVEVITNENNKLIMDNPNLSLEFYTHVGILSGSAAASTTSSAKGGTDSLLRSSSTAPPPLSTIAVLQPPPPTTSSKKGTTEITGTTSRITQKNDSSTSKSKSHLKISRTKRFTTQQLWKFRCGQCTQCTKPDCQRCDTCLRNASREKENNTLDSDLECCLQKTCSKLTAPQKSQPAFPIFPKGWEFYFDLEQRKSKPNLAVYQGLVLVAPSKSRTYTSVEAAIRQNPKSLSKHNLAQLFYKYVGLRMEDIIRGKATTSSTQNKTNILIPGMSSSATTTTTTTTTIPGLQQGKYIESQKYPNKKTVGARVYCKFSNGEWYWGSILNVRGKGSAIKYSILFDDGDFLAVPASDVCTEHEYVRVFKAEPPPKKEDDDEEESDLSTDDYKNLLSGAGVGKTKTDSMVQEVVEDKADTTDAKTSESSVEKDVSPKHEGDPYTPQELFKRRCKSCSLCMKPTCGKCICCIHNACRTRSYREVCLQKMCKAIPEDAKVQPAAGFPDGWKFFFADPKTMPYSFQSAQKLQHRNLSGLVLLAPNGRKYSSVERALNAYSKKLEGPENLEHEFYRHVGIHLSVIDDNDDSSSNILNGHGYCHEWTNVNGQKMTLFGKIMHCEIEYGIKRYLIQYDEESRKLVNLVSTGCDTFVPHRQKHLEYMTWGGCMRYDAIVNYDNYSNNREGNEKPKKKKKTLLKILAAAGKLPFHYSWIVPDMRVEDHEMITVGDKTYKVPRVTLVVRGYKLIFTVRTSGIPNAGFGVFVICTSLRSDNGNDNDSDDNSSAGNFMSLAAGELIDVGVYAPFRMQDRKEEHIFLLKNFIHSLNCEEWCFDTRDECHMFDITDDYDGEIHDLARSHLPAYVNETDGIAHPTIRAEFDPEGAVHYLLGHAEEHFGKLHIPADGRTRTEIFIDYGSRYENVRIRKGYSRLSEKEQEAAKQQCAKDEAEYVYEIKDYSATEVDEGIKFLNKQFVLNKRKKCGSSNDGDDNSSAKASTITTDVIDGSHTPHISFPNPKIRERALLIALCLKARIRSIKKEFRSIFFANSATDDQHKLNSDVVDSNSGLSNDDFCDNGVSMLDMEALMKAADELIGRLRSAFNNDDEIKESLLSNELYIHLLETMLSDEQIIKEQNGASTPTTIASTATTSISDTVSSTRGALDKKSDSDNSKDNDGNNDTSTENKDTAEDTSTENKDTAEDTNYFHNWSTEKFIKFVVEI